jgi:hypothetical protein
LGGRRRRALGLMDGRRRKRDRSSNQRQRRRRKEAIAKKREELTITVDLVSFASLFFYLLALAASVLRAHTASGVAYRCVIEMQHALGSI